MIIGDERCTVKCLTCDKLLVSPRTGKPELFLTQAEGRMVANRRGWNVDYHYNQFLCLACNARNIKRAKKNVYYLIEKGKTL